MTEGSIAVSSWLKFFKDAGIPAGLGANYAVIFSDHRIQPEILGDLTREILVEMGIKAMGDIIAVLKHAKAVSEQISRDKTSQLLGVDDSPKRETLAADAVGGKSVFSRLGQDSASDPNRVFKRLGDQVPASKQDEDSFAGALKPDSTGTRVKKSVPVTIKRVADSPSPVDKKVVTTKMKKRQSILDRLGPATAIISPPATKKSRPSVEENLKVKKTVLKKRFVQRPSDLSSESSESEPEVRKSPKIIRLISKPAAKKKVVLKVGKRVTLRKSTAVPAKKTTILDRLGSKVSSTTTTKASQLAMRQKAPNTSVAQSLAKKKLVLPTGNLRSDRMKSDVRQRLSKKKIKPISSNDISSTTSAGIFKREVTMTQSSVFDRLGPK
ncbi:uncharacterized protein LOC143463242 isoform X1 [Clavelina lepadiformis]|uniref:DUF5577 domain-containing protein n=1 Tax=Clavelina lepadiformis TaxID=159417 RepID=A0ABP0FN27_CLALP